MMLRRFSRLVAGVFLLIVLCVLSVSVLQRGTLSGLQRVYTDPDLSLPQPHNDAPPRPASSSSSSAERFLSYSRTSGPFSEQWDALRSGARLAYQSNRTLLAPPLQLGDPSTQRWIDIPWSLVFDFSTIRDEFGIRIVDEPQAPPAPAQLIETEGKGSETWSSRLTQWLFQAGASRSTEDGDTVLVVPRLHDFVALETAHVRFDQGMSYLLYRRELVMSPGQTKLINALATHLLLRPDGMPPIALAANQIIRTLGGPRHYDGLTIRFAEYNNVTREPIDDDSDEADDEPMDNDGLKDDLVLELLSGLPINIAVSAALPIQDSTPLAAALERPAATSTHTLLSACLDYRRNTDTRFPVFYLVSDIDPADRPELFAPLYRLFPCIFTERDLVRRRNVDLATQMDPYISARGDATTSDDVTDMLQTIVDIVVAGESYSHLELPASAKSNLVALIQKNHYYRPPTDSHI